MKKNAFGWVACCAATSVFFLGACGSNNSPSTMSNAGGEKSGGSGGKGGQAGQTTTSGGGSAGNTGGASGQGGTKLQTDTAVGGGSGSGQGGTTTLPPIDASGSGVDGPSASPKDVAPADAYVVTNPRRVIIADEGIRKISLVDLTGTATAVWSTQVDAGKYGDSMRDIQLVGGDRLAVSTGKGYVEIDLKTGEIKKDFSKLGGVESIRRLPNGNTVLCANADGGVTLYEIDKDDTMPPLRKVTFANLSQFRMMRRTPQGTFLLGVGGKVAEVNWEGKVVWEMAIPNGNYVYQGLRLPDETIAVTSGYGASIAIVDPKAKTVKTTIGGKDQPEAGAIAPNFYAGFQILPNGHFVVANWEGHGPGNGGKGTQLLEYDATGKLVWQWKQDPKLVSSLHHVIVLDGLDTTKLQDDVNGILGPVTQ